MGLLNEDGTPYKAIGSIQQFNPENKQHCLFSFWDEEAIRQGGSPIYYYEVFIQINNTFDPIYREDRGKLWSNFPVELWAMYEPIPSQNYQNAYGIDSPDDIIFEMNYDAVIRDLGHLPKPGSRIFTPHLRENWEVISNKTGEFKTWGIIRIQTLCRRWQETVTTGEGKVSQAQPDFKIDAV